MTVEITDVYLRDGLQDEPVVVSTDQKLTIVEKLIEAGIRRIEAGSFVNPRRVPQMADASELFPRLPKRSGVTFTALALNERGVQRAVDAGADEVTLVVSASEAHSQANAGRSIEHALQNLAKVVEKFPSTRFAAGIATAFRCPYEGDIAPERVIRVVQRFRDMGIEIIGLADTLGTTPTRQLLSSFGAIRRLQPTVEYSLHLHNVNGQALNTAVEAAKDGVTKFDAALAGYGGCPFAPGASGNLATEVLTEEFATHGIETGIDPARLADAVNESRRAVENGQPIHERQIQERKAS